MYRELYQYLILNKHLSIPGIGTFLLERKPADVDFINKQVNPPSYSISLQHGQTTVAKNFFDWLADSLNISEMDAVDRFNDFAYDLKEYVLAGNKLFWEGIGTLTKGLAGEIRFESALKDQPAGEPVAAVKVLRDNAEHTVRVGEDEKTSGEMIELLQTPGKRKISRRAAVWTVLVLAVLFLAFYFMSNGLKLTATGNQQPLTPATESPTHKLTP